MMYLFKRRRLLRKLFLQLLFCFAFLNLIACGEGKSKNDDALETATWEDIEQMAKGQTVNFMMWQGSPVINDYINNYLIPNVKEKYGITLKISGGQGPEIVQLAMGEMQAGIDNGQIDMVWINGETFFQLSSINALYGPFVKTLPNSQYVNFEDRFISIDFQQDIAGMEAPWSMSQFAVVHDSEKVPDPPTNLDELEQYLIKYPGTFTISNDFTGMTLLKSFLAELGGSSTSLDGEFDQEKYDRLSGELWKWINAHKKYFWKQGSTFPKEQSIMSQLFANGELYLTAGFSEGGIEERVRSGLYPKSTKAYAWKNGSIKNANYLGILGNAPQKAAAMQVINFLMSPDAQLKKNNPEGMDSNTILDIKKLPKEWQERFAQSPKRQYGITLKDLEDNTIAEPAPEYMIHMYDDFRTQVIEK
jgi:putative spermidine/putrescine transport system substrate-binding protein